MKAVLAAVLLVTVVVASSKEAATQPVDPQSEDRTIVAQRFCPNGRC
jgi:hypothetical protein